MHDARGIASYHQPLASLRVYCGWGCTAPGLLVGVMSFIVLPLRRPELLNCRKACASRFLHLSGLCVALVLPFAVQGLTTKLNK